MIGSRCTTGTHADHGEARNRDRPARRHQPRHRGGRRLGAVALAGGDRRRDRAQPACVRDLAARLARATGRGCCAASPPSSTTTSRSSRSSRCATPVTRSATRAGRRATSATCWPTTRERPNGCSATRSRWPAASTSRSTSRSASSGSSCRGTSRCRSPAGASPRRSPPATPWCSSRRSSRRSPRCGSAELALEAGLPEHVFQVLTGKGSVVGERFVTQPGRRQGGVHRVDRGGHPGRRGLRPAGQAGHPRARGQERQRRVRRRGSRAGLRPPRRTPCSTTRARTAAPDRASSSSARCSTTSSRCSSPRSSACGWRTPASTPPRWVR